METCYQTGCDRPGTHVVVGHEDANHDGAPLCTDHVLVAVADLITDPEWAGRVEPVGFFPY